MVLRALIITGLLAGGLLLAEEPAPATPEGPAQPATGQPAAAQPAAKPEFTINTGTKVPLTLINSVSTKHSMEGDSIYLQTVFPILVNGKIVIPVGSYVTGTVTQIKRPGRVKGRGELFVRFDSLTLPNGTTRNFRGRIGGMDGTASGTLDRDEGKVTGAGNKKGDLETIGEAASAGTTAGGLIGGLGMGHPGMGVGIGAAAGAAAGMIGVLLSRGPDAVLEKGTTLEMVLDRPVAFTENEVNFGNYQAPPIVVSPSAQTTTTQLSSFPF